LEFCAKARQVPMRTRLAEQVLYVELFVEGNHVQYVATGIVIFRDVPNVLTVGDHKFVASFCAYAHRDLAGVTVEFTEIRL
jgi:hypothetical protein